MISLEDNVNSLMEEWPEWCRRIIELSKLESPSRLLIRNLLDKFVLILIFDLYVYYLPGWIKAVPIVSFSDYASTFTIYVCDHHFQIYITCPAWNCCIDYFTQEEQEKLQCF